ncbi:MAG: class I SAM-dependent RNA methyltransferase [Bacillaceae bacterium]
MKKVTLIATAAMGLEALVAKEVRDLGYECKVDNGKIEFEGDLLAICRANLWLRTADRVKLKLAEFKATTFEELFQKTKAIDWHRYIPLDGNFPVIGKSHKSKLFSVPDCQAIVKKATVEKLRESYRVDWFPEKGAMYKIEVAILKDIVTITLDTSGAGLHKRGYRVGQGEAPLKETMAAALIQLTNWRSDRPFVDPFCGSGTIPIEAALIAHNIAPGTFREFVSESWTFIPKALWKQARDEAESLARYDEPVNIVGCDIDHRMIEIAKANAEEIGLGDSISFKQMQMKDFTTKEEYGYVVTNPPYGERLSEKALVEQIYSDMGYVFQKLDTWSIYVLTSHEGFEQYYGKPASKKRKLFNGFIKCDYYQYFGKRPPRVVKVQ